VEVLAQVDNGRLMVDNAANLLDLTRRQARGKPPNNRLHKAKRNYALSLIKENYPDFRPTLAAEMLAEHHGFKVSRETLRKWMIEDGIMVALWPFTATSTRCSGFPRATPRTALA